ncbi:hypothetical protein TCAL_08602 [Tigriopus californicus]|uniref:Uncharacterized protein n=2 Tax=Tigriopus californicus TaxID=6832 RepID=A0A553PJY9_TIGCA|nr:hypothetical protein TCAL_08602 [Tigriopus californicus]
MALNVWRISWLLAKSRNPSLDTILDSLNCSDANSVSADKPWLKNFLSERKMLERTIAMEECDSYFTMISSQALHQVTEEETNFPLAFSHLIHENVGILEMFLSTHFRPTDTHCIVIDQKSTVEVQKATKAVVNCYQRRFPRNPMFIVDNNISVYNGHISILQAELDCLEELEKRNKEWKMFLNLAGNDLPLVSMTKIRETLSNHKDQNNFDLGFTPTNSHQKIRLEIVDNGEGHRSLREYPDTEKAEPPCKLFIMKGYRNVALTRDFATFLLKSHMVKVFLEWISTTSHPAEHFYATMGTIQEADGPEDGTKLITQRFDMQKSIASQICFREHLWRPSSHCMLRKSGCNVDLQKSPLMNNMRQEYIGNNWFAGYCLRKSKWSNCAGSSRERKCLITLQDSPEIRESGCLFANEFHVDLDPGAIMCQVKYVKAQMAESDAQSKDLNPM